MVFIHISHHSLFVTTCIPKHFGDPHSAHFGGLLDCPADKRQRLLGCFCFFFVNDLSDCSLFFLCKLFNLQNVFTELPACGCKVVRYGQLLNKKKRRPIIIPRVYIDHLISAFYIFTVPYQIAEQIALQQMNLVPKSTFPHYTSNVGA